MKRKDILGRKKKRDEKRGRERWSRNETQVR